MKKNQTVKVTLKYHPNKAIGEKYEIVKIVGAITVELDSDQTVRVSDCLDEADATTLADVTEVTVVPE